VTWLEGHCISFGQASPFLPLIELLREHFEIDEFDGEPDIIAKVEQGMRRMGELEAHLHLRVLNASAPMQPHVPSCYLTLPVGVCTGSLCQPGARGGFLMHPAPWTATEKAA